MVLRTMCTQYVYHQHYRPSHRKSEKQDYETNMASWAEFAHRAAFAPTSRWDNKLLQITTPSGNVFAKSPNELTNHISTTAIYHQVRSKEICSRIQLITTASFTGQPLYKHLLPYLSGSPAVSAWKVMNPELGSTGPDSAVIYLNMALDSLPVQELIKTLATNLAAYLEAPSVPPLGLEVLCPGIYGLDVPTPQQQVEVLGITPKDMGSAGTIVSALISKAAVALDKHLSTNVTELARFNKDKKWYMRNFFENVLKLNLNWNLT
jgi:hypothetical protein